MKRILNDIKTAINEADYILIGAGSGLSTAAGIEYSGKRFKDNFKEYIEKYHFTDMYTSSFYNFKTEEEKWAYFAKHIYLNNTGMRGTETYKNILKLMQDKEYFVITTNVDDQFFKSGFDEGKIFATQGSYRYIQCGKACHNKLYDDTELVKEMIEKTVDLKIPSTLVPKCPVCGEKMEVNLRKDEYFVEDDKWFEQYNKYKAFLNKIKDKKVVLLEFGVGFNTPGIIRLPFEKLVSDNNNYTLIRFNKENTSCSLDIDKKVIKVKEDINKVLNELV